MPVPPKSASNLHRETSQQINTPVQTTDRSAELLIDEADALFSKRTEVRDAHDRYSNDSTDPLPHKP